MVAHCSAVCLNRGMETETRTTERTIHTGCLVTDFGNGFGRCTAHLVRVYQDGHDWHVMHQYTGGAIEVLDDHDRHGITHRVTVTCPVGASDEALAEVAGYHSRHHFGYSVTRYDDGTALVSLWND